MEAPVGQRWGLGGWNEEKNLEGWLVIKDRLMDVYEAEAEPRRPAAGGQRGQLGWVAQWSGPRKKGDTVIWPCHDLIPS